MMPGATPPNGTKPPGNSLIGVGIMGSVDYTDCVTLLRTKENL